MPQEIRVLQCFECKIFQVDIAKKSRKWSCKVCGAKQTLRREFFRGSGSECRTKVQLLNKERQEQLQKEEETTLSLLHDEDWDWDAISQLEDQSKPQCAATTFNSIKEECKRSNYVATDKQAPGAKKVEQNTARCATTAGYSGGSKWSNYVATDETDIQCTTGKFRNPLGEWSSYNAENHKMSIVKPTAKTVNAIEQNPKKELNHDKTFTKTFDTFDLSNTKKWSKTVISKTEISCVKRKDAIENVTPSKKCSKWEQFT